LKNNSIGENEIYEGRPEKRRGVDIIHFKDGKIINKFQNSDLVIQFEKMAVNLCKSRNCMIIGDGNNSGIQGFGNLGIEGILPVVSFFCRTISFNLLNLSFNPSIPQFLNPSIFISLSVEICVNPCPQ